MCEMFGYSGCRPLDVSPYLKVLASHSPEHPHGWGIATMYGTAVNVEKEPKCAWVSDYLRSRLDYPIEAAAGIAHIRQATCGSMAYINCHPFTKQDASNRTWTLAHNGTIFDSPLLDTYKGVQLGSTDSERILCLVIHRSNDLLSSKSDLGDPCLRFQMVDRIILEIAQHNKLNLLLYDGEYLYVHTNMAGTLYRKSIDCGTLFATVPLDESGWETVPMMQLLVYDRGTLVFRGIRHPNEYIKAMQQEDNSSWIGL